MVLDGAAAFDQELKYMAVAFHRAGLEFLRESLNGCMFYWQKEPWYCWKLETGETMEPILTVETSISSQARRTVRWMLGYMEKRPLLTTEIRVTLDRTCTESWEVQFAATPFRTETIAGFSPADLFRTNGLHLFQSQNT